MFSSFAMATDVQPPTLNQLAKTQGFFFFYSASCPHCQRFAPTLKRFSERYGFSVLPISVDGGFLSSFPHAVVDEGQKNAFGVNMLPSLFIVNPKNQKAALVSEGNIDEATLTEHMLKIASMLTKEDSL